MVYPLLLFLKSTTLEIFQIASSLERHLNSNSRITVCAKLSQLYSLILSNTERKKCLDRCLEQFDSHDVSSSLSALVN